MKATRILPALCLLAAACINGGEEQAAAGGESADPTGRCAEDARDGERYGRIVTVETDLTTGDRMYSIEGEGGVSWKKKAANVRVVDCS